METGYGFKTILLVGIFLALILAGCRKSPAEPGLTPAATHTPPPSTPTPAPPTQTPTLTPTPNPYGWQALSLDNFAGVAAQGDNPGCAKLYPDLEPGAEDPEH